MSEHPPYLIIDSTARKMRWKEALLQEVICMTDAAVRTGRKMLLVRGQGSVHPSYALVKVKVSRVAHVSPYANKIL